ncbi:hypothetical protein [Metapseudomonas furukawaii]|jgi:hypothetical protein|uniref:Uncharacterized protein n=1 Tax=Metapseudomonas furukawaii TaxID=1149133 RepID=L8MCV1_METFU|nr:MULTISPECIES: hypothetical protein [Pseudomonas]ELS25366.1 hypothetical protein ppKF707_4576 [Pseudomonas furukawaii]ELS29202.1 hypothetical protein ppKF707_4193 [Pseudomonas furukawaii]OWJ97599.1 hypothetical protein B6S59_03320 [Pseudomonas sp. A46]WAG81204.1 hypothetical protein LMK08_11265 [Pseudomonas furukawaii]BAU73980.1 hypothetical protein KF707C_22920 [Pseudomonas furukawaii]
MEIAIQQVRRDGRDEWLVEALGLRVPFRDRASALAFALRLQERVDAPHRLPASRPVGWGVTRE